MAPQAVRAANPNFPRPATEVTPRASPDYFRAVERTFLDLKGGGMFLSPADWDVVRGWEERGVPLDVALSGIRTAFSRRTRAPSRMSLGECAAAVEAAFDALRLRRSGAGSRSPEDNTEVRHRLAQLADQLRKWSPAPGSFPDEKTAAELVAAASEAAAELDRLGRDEGASAGAERVLGRIQDALLIRLQAALPDATLGEIESAVRNKLEPYRRRMPESTWRETYEQAVRRRVGQVVGFGPLTLFE